MKPNKKRDPFDYGNYIITYREDRESALIFLKKRLITVDEALREAAKLNDSLYHDVLIKTNN